MTEKLSVHRIELLIFDHDELGIEEIISVLQDMRYPNRCIRPSVMSSSTIEVDWDDEHPLNKRSAQKEAFETLFKK